MRKRAMLMITGAGAIAAVQLYEPPSELMAGSAAVDPARMIPIVNVANAALGASGEVRMRFVRAGERVAFPLDIKGDRYGFTSSGCVPARRKRVMLRVTTRATRCLHRSNLDSTNCR